MKSKFLSLIFIWVLMIDCIYATSEVKASFRLEEVAHVLDSTSPATTPYMIYKIIPEGFPKYKAPQLIVERPDRKNCGTYRLFINEEGELMNIDSMCFVLKNKRHSRPFLLVVDNPAYAEHIHCHLSIANQNTSYNYTTTATPFPVEVTDGPRLLELVLLNTEKRLYAIKGYNFKPCEKLMIDILTQSYESELVESHTCWVNPNGCFFQEIPHLLKKRFSMIRVQDKDMNEFYLNLDDVSDEMYPRSSKWYKEIEGAEPDWLDSEFAESVENLE